MNDARGDSSCVWISGASSGIGAALMQAVPYAGARVFGIARRAPALAEHLPADLSQPAGWSAVKASFEEVLARGAGEAVFLHFAGEGAPHGRASDADPDRYATSVLLNAAAGPILGQAFLRTCRRHEVRANLVICSSPAALAPHRGTSHYGAAKAALLHWSEVVRQEEPDSLVLTVIPWATDTPMLREAVAQPGETNPISPILAQAVSQGDVVSPEQAASEIWQAVLAGAPVSPINVGRVPDEVREADPTVPTPSEVS